MCDQGRFRTRRGGGRTFRRAQSGIFDPLACGQRTRAPARSRSRGSHSREAPGVRRGCCRQRGRWDWRGTTSAGRTRAYPSRLSPSRLSIGSRGPPGRSRVRCASRASRPFGAGPWRLSTRRVAQSCLQVGRAHRVGDTGDSEGRTALGCGKIVLSLRRPRIGRARRAPLNSSPFCSRQPAPVPSPWRRRRAA